jgi:hypothetical protein
MRSSDRVEEYRLLMTIGLLQTKQYKQTPNQQTFFRRSNSAGVMASGLTNTTIHNRVQQMTMVATRW